MFLFILETTKMWTQISVLLIVWSACAHGQVQPCNYPKIRHGRLFNENRYKVHFQASIGQSFFYSCDQNFTTPSDTYWDIVTCTQTGWEPKVPCRKICSQSDIEIENGLFSETTLKYPLYQQAKYRCKAGYVTASGETSGSITCRENGWSARPVCIRSCDRPAFENAVIKQSGTSFKLNDHLEYECKPGYENREGRTTGSIVCERNGWSHQPACFEKECHIPILEANIIAKPKKQKYKVGEVLKFSCGKRLERVGPDSVQCYHFGWSPKLPTCRERVKQCGPPPPLLNGKSAEIKRDVYEHRAMVEYVCNPRFLMKGGNKIQCVDGEWTALPMCIAEKSTCKDIPKLVNGFAEPSDPPYYHGDSIKFSCIDDFKLAGTRSITCILGKWTRLPECIATHKLTKCTFRVKSSSNPSLYDEKLYSHDTEIWYKCKEDSEEQYSTCINGQWDPVINCNEKPKRVCPPPPQIPNAQNITTTVNYQDGDKIPILCQKNFLLQKSEEIECKNGIWQSIPHCVEKVSCPQPPQIEHGTIITASSSLESKVYPHGTILNYMCKAGFRSLEQDNRITCSFGKWSLPPLCVALPCGSPPQISHGIIHFKLDHYQYGDEVMYSCLEGYGTDGPATTICLGGKWSSPPECTRKCGPPPPIANGDITSYPLEEYVPKSKVEYQCQFLYRLQGNSTIVCQDGQWSEPPTCLEPCVISEDIMNKNRIRLRLQNKAKQYLLSGYIIKFACKPGYYRKSSYFSFQVICRNGKIKYPTCS